MNDDFHGAKVAVFIGKRLLVALRDDFVHIPFPNCWDLAGGGREAGETPEACVMRELEEEFGLRLSIDALQGKDRYPVAEPAGHVYFFAAHLPEGAEVGVVFGDEGQRWALEHPDTYLARENAIPHLQERLRVYLERLA